MALVPMKEILTAARKEERGVGMFNVVGLEYAEAITEAAEEMNFPVILGLPDPFLANHKEGVIAEMMTGLARRASVPVAVHLDHGGSFERVMEALRQGFSSVMFDGSALPFEENIRQTAEIVRIAHAMGASVEGELGYLGFTEGAPQNVDHFTKPQEAAEYVERTGVDALAVAVGNMHGHYRGTPKLDLVRLSEIRDAVECPLVLHGGSGLSEQDFQNAVHAGINKINIFTHLNDITAECVKKGLEEMKPWYVISEEMKAAVREQVKDLIRIFGCL